MATNRTQTKRPRTAHSFAERKRAVELSEAGLSSKRIARELGLDDAMVRCWIRKYRATGLESLQPYWRAPRPERPPGRREVRRQENESRFAPAFEAYATTLEPVSSITRRFGLDYQRFVYHLKRHHPELVERRKRLPRLISGEIGKTV